MLRRMVGLVGAGARDASARARLEAALPDAAAWEADGVALRHTGPAPDRAGDVTCMLDGRIDVGPSTERALAEAWAEHGLMMLDDLRGDFVVLFWNHRT